MNWIVNVIKSSKIRSKAELKRLNLCDLLLGTESGYFGGNLLAISAGIACWILMVGYVRLNSELVGRYNHNISCWSGQMVV